MTNKLYILSLLFFMLFCSKEDNGGDKKDDLVEKAKKSNSVSKDENIKNSYDSSTGSPLSWTKKWQKDGYRTAIDNSSKENLKGDITKDKTLSKSKLYILQGGVYVKKGATLTIEAGTIISSYDKGTNAYLVVERGAKIIAKGTASNPIIFTSGKAKPNRGDWGGIIICGSAPINRSGGESLSEMGDSKYGGNKTDDNSGVLEYVVVEYTGSSINAEKEHNGVTFNGVGNLTVIDNVVSYMGGDDAFEWFGGTVNASNLLSYGAKDDLFDWTYGWVGKLDNILGIQSSDVGDRGIEGDNSSKNRTSTPFSNPNITKGIIIGNKKGDKDGVKLREGTKVKNSEFLYKEFFWTSNKYRAR